MKNIGFAIFFIAALTSCQHFSNRNVPVIRVQAAQVGLAAFQQIEVRYGKEYRRFDAAIEFSEGKMSLLILSELSQHLATIRINGSEVTMAREGVFSSPVPLKRLVKSLQVVFWPESSLEQFFLNSEWSIIARAQRRELYFRGELASYVDYSSTCPWQGEITYVDVVDHVKIIIKSTLLDIDTSLTNGSDCSV